MLPHIQEPKNFEGRHILMTAYWNKIMKWNCLKASMVYNEDFFPVSKNTESAIIS
jgi:hypothetical protein